MRRRDHHHHHPKVEQLPPGVWQWRCSCGGHSARNGSARPWRLILIEALGHSEQIAA